jgi:DNA gyrase subunit B
MPELIERGHIFIAQPPLYKVTRGKSQQYLKDERALEDFLIEQGVDGAVLRLSGGEERAGRDLRALVEEARIVRTLLNGLHSRYSRSVVEQAALAGALKPAGEAGEAQALAELVARRLDGIADEIERGWTGRFENDDYIFERTIRGVKQVATLDHQLLGSADARKINEHIAALQDVFREPGILTRKGEESQVNGATSLFDAMTAVGRKGLTLQRYKGLGEMNPEQLWETTLDRTVRSLLQVKVKEGTDADDLFTKLMGDVVEPRRDFIQTNALNVANLDV